MIEYENLKKANEIFFPELKDAFNDFLESGWFILGDSVKRFEQNFASFCQTKYCIGVASGLDALILSLKALELPKGSEVIVPSNTYIATILAILNEGLIPVLVEPKIETYNIDPSLIESSITDKTRAIIPVHLYGKACEMTEIYSIAEKYSLNIIEDCAQAHGASINGKKVGSFGDFGAFSFYPTKNLGAIGDAGAITTNDKNRYEKLLALRNYGSEKKYYNKYIGVNSRLDEIQAKVLDIKLKKLDLITEHKRKLASIYSDLLTEKVKKPVLHYKYFDVFHIYNICTSRRDELKEYLLSKGIKTEIHYPVVPVDQECMVGIINGESSIARKIHNETLSLPISFATSIEDVKNVSREINLFFEN